VTLKDTINGPGWIIWGIFILFSIISIVLLSGHGANLIAGYNTATEEEKARYDTKRLCRVVGAGFALITITILIAAIWVDVLPASFSSVLLGVILTTVVFIIVLANTICKKKE
jgi:hypothetical protein